MSPHQALLFCSVRLATATKKWRSEMFDEMHRLTACVPLLAAPKMRAKRLNLSCLVPFDCLFSVHSLSSCTRRRPDSPMSYSMDLLANS